MRWFVEPYLFKVSNDHRSGWGIFGSEGRYGRFPEGAKIAGERTLGFAILPEEGGFGNLIYLSLHHIQKYSDEQKAPVELVLGLVIAHEIAHLLGLREHSPTGIMRAYWDKVDLLRAQVGELQFTDQQAGFLRAAILARSKRITDLQAAAVVSRP